MTAPEVHPRDDVCRSDDRKESSAVGKASAQEQSALNPEARECRQAFSEILSMPEAADIEIDFTRPPSYPRPAIFD
jgi:hypothetical protein